MTAARTGVTLASVNLGMRYVPPKIRPQSIVIDGDIDAVLRIVSIPAERAVHAGQDRSES